MTLLSGTDPAAKVRVALRSDLGRKTGWAMVGDVSRYGSAAVSFVLLARILGASSFGRYAGAFAFVSIFFPFATLGAGQLLIRDVSRDPSTFPAAWGAALRRAAFGAAATIVLAIALRPLVLPQAGAGVVVILGIAELAGTSFVELSAQAFQAFHRLRASSIVRATMAASRLAVLLGFLVCGASHTATSWVPWYLGASLFSAAVAFAYVTSTLGAPDPSALRAHRTLRTGIPFSFNLSAAYVQDDIDKALVLRYQPASVAGLYTAGYRFLNMALVPVWSFVTATYPRFFQAGAHGLASSTRLARQLCRPGIVYGLLAGTACVAAAPFVPVLLGQEYNDSARVLAALAFLPTARVLQLMGGDALTGAGHQGYRSTCQAGTCVLNIALNVALIPRYSWHGAVAATLISEVTLVVVLWALIRVLLRGHEAPSEQAGAVVEGLLL